MKVKNPFAICFTFLFFIMLTGTAHADTYWSFRNDEVYILVNPGSRGIPVLVHNLSKNSISWELSDLKFHLKDGTSVSAPFCDFKLLSGWVGGAMDKVSLSPSEERLLLLKDNPRSYSGFFVPKSPITAISYRSGKFKKLTEKEFDREMNRINKKQW